MSNHLKNGSSYVAYQATKRRNRAAEFAAQQDALGAHSQIDGNQAIIDLALEMGDRLAQWLVDSLERQGYDIPDAVRPRTMDEAGSASDTPASNVAPASEDRPDPTTDSLPCQAAALLDDPRVEGVAFSGPWTKPQTAVSFGGQRWTRMSPVSWFESEAEAQRRGWKAIGKGQGYLRPVGV